MTKLPSYYFMQYDLATWNVRNLLLVPYFAFPPSAIIKRKPLSVTARRAGWVGCNFALNRIPAEARIEIIVTSSSGRSSEREFAHSKSQSRLTSAATIIVPPAEVREKFRRIKPLKDISVKQRGCTLDVLNIVRRLIEERRCPHRSNFARHSDTGKFQPRWIRHVLRLGTAALPIGIHE